MLEGYAGMTAVYLSEWRNGRTEFKKEARNACKQFARFARTFPIGKSRYHLCMGWYYQLAGWNWRSKHHLQKSLAHAQKIGLPYDEALAYHDIARLSAIDSPKRADYLSRAENIFTRIGAHKDAEKCRATKSGKTK